MTSLPQKPPARQSGEPEAEYIPLASPRSRTRSPQSVSPLEKRTPSQSQDPPLPSEEPPPLPAEPPPVPGGDDGWEPVWDENASAFYFYNRITQASQWENPRVPDAGSQGPVDSGPPGAAAALPAKPTKPAGGYNPAIHGDYDPNADYAQTQKASQDTLEPSQPQVANPSETYAATGTFNRFTGKWQRADLNPENFSDESKSSRQMNAFFDVDAAANSHNGRSLKAERANKKLSKKELKAFKEKRRERKEEKRRAWLRD